MRYTLPEDNQQIFASRYKLYLPTESELAAELQREREAIEIQRRLRINSKASEAIAPPCGRALALAPPMSLE